ncbi:MAG: DNA repair protein RecO [Cyclobacteriaceae bacterium]|nr:DNA repair protein RecO [Cyclobacteriaceae bacterium]
MLHKTQGIVFKYIKYRDSSIIVNIFTEKFGLQSYIVNGVRSKSSKNKIALFQPLTCLELVVYHKENSEINRISELKCNHPFHSIPINIHKSSIALFLTEILHKTIKEQNDTEDLFVFIQQAVLVLDNLSIDYENFHLQFLLQLSRYLGFGVSQNNELESLMLEAKIDFQLLNELNRNPFGHHVSLNGNSRQRLLKAVLRYYKQHYTTLGEIKSLTVLSEVLR